MAFTPSRALLGRSPRAFPKAQKQTSLRAPACLVPPLTAPPQGQWSLQPAQGTSCTSGSTAFSTHSRRRYGVLRFWVKVTITRAEGGSPERRPDCYISAQG